MYDDKAYWEMAGEAQVNRFNYQMMEVRDIMQQPDKIDKWFTYFPNVNADSFYVMFFKSSQLLENYITGVAGVYKLPNIYEYRYGQVLILGMAFVRVVSMQIPLIESSSITTMILLPSRAINIAGLSTRLKK